jgi:SNF2 family DNA or RNA helicase
VEAQATDRAYRIGQIRTVYSVKLITKGTIEEKVLAMQDRKRAIIDATLENDEQVMDKLSWDDVQQLLEL